MKKEETLMIKAIINGYAIEAYKEARRKWPEASDDAIIENFEGKVNEFIAILYERADELAELGNYMKSFEFYLDEAKTEQMTVNWGHTYEVLCICTAECYINNFDFEVMPFSIEAIN